MAKNNKKKIEKDKVRFMEHFSVKLIITLVALLLVKIGNGVPIPTINSAFRQIYATNSSGVLGILNRFSGDSFKTMSIFALGITVYITSSIVIQLLTVVFKRMEQLEQNGAYGKKQMERITVVFAVVMSIVSALAFAFTFSRNGYLSDTKITTMMLTAGCFLIGSLILIGLGKMIEKKGIGNGISMILMVNLLSYIPNDSSTIYQNYIKSKPIYMIGIVAVIVLVMILLSVFVNIITKKEYLQYAQSPIGEEDMKDYSYISISGKLLSIMPVILTSSCFQIVAIIGQMWNKLGKHYAYYTTTSWFVPKHMKYTLGFIPYVLLMVFFAYFYMSITFNETRMAHQFKKEGITIVGIRPGMETAKHLKKSVRRIIWIVIALLLIVIATPMIISGVTNVAALSMGGTSLVIIVGVLMETYRSLKAEWLTHKYAKKQFI